MGPKQRPAKATKPPATTRKTPGRRKAKAPETQQKTGQDSSGPGRTYSRQVSDKENEGKVHEQDDGNNDSQQPDTSSDAELSDEGGQVGRKGGAAVPAEVKATKELKTLAQKFQEVDAWQMEFEEVTASSSSPRDGR